MVNRGLRRCRPEQWKAAGGNDGTSEASPPVSLIRFVPAIAPRAQTTSGQARLFGATAPFPPPRWIGGVAHSMCRGAVV
jgi:hypothetical protein